MNNIEPRLRRLIEACERTHRNPHVRAAAVALVINEVCEAPPRSKVARSEGHFVGLRPADLGRLLRAATGQAMRIGQATLSSTRADVPQDPRAASLAGAFDSLAMQLPPQQRDQLKALEQLDYAEERRWRARLGAELLRLEILADKYKEQLEDIRELQVPVSPRASALYRRVREDLFGPNPSDAPHAARGVQLREARLQRGMSRCELALHLEVPVLKVTSFERGVDAPSREQGAALAAVLGDPRLRDWSET